MLVVLLSACSFHAGTLQGVDDANGPDDTGGSGSDDADPDLDAAIGEGAASGFASGLTSASIHRRMVDLVDAQVAGGPHTDFPLLVSLATTWLRTTANGGEVASASGFDIHFSADALGAVPLAHEIETYLPTTGVLVAWVKVPALAAATVIYIHDGDPSITASTETPTAVWSNGYELVMHLDGTADSTTAPSSGPGGDCGGIGRLARPAHAVVSNTAHSERRTISHHHRMAALAVFVWISRTFGMDPSRSTW